MSDTQCSPPSLRQTQSDMVRVGYGENSETVLSNCGKDKREICQKARTLFSSPFSLKYSSFPAHCEYPLKHSAPDSSLQTTSHWLMNCRCTTQFHSQPTTKTKPATGPTLDCQHTLSTPSRFGVTGTPNHVVAVSLSAEIRTVGDYCAAAVGECTL